MDRILISLLVSSLWLCKTIYHQRYSWKFIQKSFKTWDNVWYIFMRLGFHGPFFSFYSLQHISCGSYMALKTPCLCERPYASFPAVETTSGGFVLIRLSRVYTITLMQWTYWYLRNTCACLHRKPHTCFMLAEHDQYVIGQHESLVPHFNLVHSLHAAWNTCIQDASE